MTVFALIGMIWAGCAEKDEPGTVEPAHKQRINIVANISPSVMSRTNVTIDSGDSDKLKTRWTTDDAIIVYNETTGDYAEFTVASIEDNGLTATFSGEIDPTGGTFQAIHMYNINTGFIQSTIYENGEMIGKGAVHDLGYHYTQAGNNNYDHLSRLTVLNGRFSLGNPMLTMSHEMAFFKFELTLPEGYAIAAGNSCEVSLDIRTSRHIGVLFETGFRQLRIAESSNLFVRVDNMPGGNTVTAYINCCPTTEASGKELMLELVVSDGEGTSTRYVKTLAAKPVRPIEKGHYYTITETMEVEPVVPSGGTVDDITPEVF